MKKSPKISVVSPVYKAEKIIDELCERLILSISEITHNFEIILIDDNSPDNSWNIILELSKKDKRIKGYKLSRNFGQHHAITAGLDKCCGEWTVVMDCDLQDKPEEIINLFNEAKKGYQIVLAARVRRKHSLMKKISSKFFYKIMNFFSGLKYDGDIANFGIYNKIVIENLKTMREPFRFFVSSIKWSGFKTSVIKVKHGNRHEGKSTYNYKKLISLGINIIISYSNKPLKFMIYTGIIFSLISILFITYNIYKKINGEITELGFTTVISSIWLLSGIMLFSLGIIGIYISKIYDGIKNRPLYIISEDTNNE